MAPFLVPIEDVAVVRGGTTGLTVNAVLQQFPEDPASGGPKTQQHFTNIHRIECLARSHPLVRKVELYNPAKALDDSKYNNFGRAVAYHQSPHDLLLSLGSSVGMVVGCSVNGARAGLLSLWWSPAKGCKLTQEQESLAQAVFLTWWKQSTTSPACTPRTTTLPLARPLLLLQPRWRA